MSYNQSRYQNTLFRITSKPTEFRQIIGVFPETFVAMVNCVKTQKYQGKKTGRLSHLCFEDQVMLMLEYYRDYPSMAKLGLEYSVNETTIGRIIKKVEKILVASSEFKLPTKKSLKQNNLELQAIIVDVTEIAVQRPKRSRFKNGKKNQK
jgi:predicted DNA-binding protein YlxM (UPF0122 family)